MSAPRPDLVELSVPELATVCRSLGLVAMADSLEASLDNQRTATVEAARAIGSGLRLWGTGVAEPEARPDLAVEQSQAASDQLIATHARAVEACRAEFSRRALPLTRGRRRWPPALFARHWREACDATEPPRTFVSIAANFVRLDGEPGIMHPDSLRKLWHKQGEPPPSPE